jgi:hypothetical protein
MQGQKVADIFASFGLDDKKLQQGLKNADKAIEKTDKKITETKTNVFSLENAFVSLGKTVAKYYVLEKITEKTFEIARASVKLAGNMRELDNVFDVFLNKSSEKFIQKSDQLANKLGRSEYQIRKMTSGGLALGKAMGKSGEEIGDVALQISELAVDLASLYNTADDEAFVAIAAALRGEQEPLRRFSILLSDATINQYALAKGSRVSTREMTEQQKAMWRWKFILENSKEAQGDAVRTQKQFANQLRVMKSNLQNVRVAIGEELIDPLTQALIVMNEFIKASKEKIEIKADTDFTDILKTMASKTFIATLKSPFQFVGDIAELIMGAGKAAGKALDIITRPFVDAVKQYKKIGVYSPDYKGKEYTARTDEWVARGNAYIMEGIKQEELKDALLESLILEFGKIDEFAKLTGMSFEDNLESKMEAVDKIIKEAVEKGEAEEKTKNILSSVRDNIKTQLSLLDEEEEAKEKEELLLKEKRQKAKQRAKEIEDEIELEKAKAEQDKKRAETLEIQKETLKAEEDLEQAKRELYYEGLNASKELISQFEGLSTEEAYKKFNELSREFSMLFELSKNADPEVQRYYSEMLDALAPAFDDATKEAEKNIKTNKDYAKTLSDVATITSELSTLFGDDLLGSMSMLMNQGASMMANWGTAGALGQAGMVMQGATMVKGIVDSFNESDIGKKQAESTERFEEAVSNFQKAVDDLSIGQKISFAQLERPSNLAGIMAGTGSSASTELNWENFLKPGGIALQGIVDMLGFGKAKNASIDTTALKEQLAGAGYGDIDVDAVMGKYAQYGSYRTWYGKKKSYISGYDVEGAMTEIQALIDDAWQQNLDNFKEAVGLMSSDFSSQFASVFKSGGDAKTALDAMLRDSFSKSVFYSEAFESLGDQLGDKFSDIIFDEVDLNIGDVSGMSFEEAYETMLKLYEDTTGSLNEEFEKLGIAVSDVTDEMESLTASTENLPSFLRIAPATTQSYMNADNRQTIVNIENNYSDEFPDKVMDIINRNNYISTGNLMGGYR